VLSKEPRFDDAAADLTDAGEKAPTTESNNNTAKHKLFIIVCRLQVSVSFLEKRAANGGSSIHVNGFCEASNVTLGTPIVCADLEQNFLEQKTTVSIFREYRASSSRLGHLKIAFQFVVIFQQFSALPGH
jgi:hypothetical protein